LFLQALVLFLGFDGQCRYGSRFEPKQADFLTGIITVAIAAIGYSG
jgi:hypothetical protein